MATTIILKKSTTQGSSPDAVDLSQAELAVNLVDRKIYTKDNSNNIVRLDGAYVGGTAPGGAVEGDLWYDTANNVLKAYDGSAWNSSGYSTISALEDVNISSAASGDFLRYNGSAWVDSAIQTGDISSGMVTQHEGDLTITESQISDLQSYALANHNHSLDSLSNVTVTSNSSGEILKWNGSAWVNNTLAEAGIAASNHTHAINNLTDVTITSAAAGNYLRYSGTAWVNNAGVPFSDITNTPTTLAGYGITDAFDGAYSSLTGVPSTFTPSAHTLGSHSDVTVTSIASGEVLKWNGSAWINNTLAEAGIAAASHTHAASAITSGTFANARISQSSVTQHEAALSITESQISDLQSYLTAEADTLATVTGRGATTSTAVQFSNATQSTSASTGAVVVTGGAGVGGNLYVGGNTVITGNLTVDGTTTSVNSNEVNIGDSIIVLNSDETGTPSQNGGIEIERGTSANVSFVWDETNDYWSLGGEQLENVVLDGGSY